MFHADSKAINDQSWSPLSQGAEQDETLAEVLKALFWVAWDFQEAVMLHWEAPQDHLKLQVAGKTGI